MFFQTCSHHPVWPARLEQERRAYARVATDDGFGGAALPPGLGVTGRPAARGRAAEKVPPVAVDASADMAELYRAEGPRLLRFFRRWVESPDEAQDLMQESFSRLLRLGGFAALLQPEAYLRRIGVNLLRDRAKFAMRRSEALHVPADDAVLAGTDQNRLLETRDLLDRLEGVVLELPAETREIFVAHRIDGLTYAEIADRTGLTIKQVEKRLVRAVSEITRVLDV